MDPLGLTLRVREDGLVEPGSPRVQQLLRQSPGLFRIVPSAGDVLVLRRVEHEDDDVAPLLLAGELRLPGALAEIVSAIAAAGWSGELLVTEGLTRRSLFIGAGNVVGASTTSLAERIGEVMLRTGVLDPEQLRVVVGKLAGGKRFGEVAIDEGFLSRERLFEVVRNQAEEIFVGAMGVRGGSFAFVEGLDATRIPGRCHLDARELVKTALARLASAGGVAVEAAALAEPIARFNKAIQSIFRAVALEGRAGALRASLDAFAAESAIDRAIFAVGRVAPDGRIDAAGVAEVLANLGVRDPRTALTKRLHEYLVYALFVASGDLPKDAERAVLAEVEGPMSGLTPRAPPARSLQPPPLRHDLAPALPPPLPPPPLAPQVAPPRPEPAPIAAPAPRPSQALVTTPAPRRRSGVVLFVVLASAIAFGVAFAVARWPLPEPTAVAPSSAPSPSPPPIPTPGPPSPPAESPSAPAAPSSSVGTIRALDPGGQDVWIDGKHVGDTPKSYEVTCGHHVVRVGNAGQPQMIEVPCGGEVKLEPR